MVDFAKTFAVKSNGFAAIIDGPEFRDQAAEVRMLINPDRGLTPRWKPQKFRRQNARSFASAGKGSRPHD
jgi:hypothetical protein